MKRLLIIFLIISGLLTAVGAIFVLTQSRPVSSDINSKTFVINQGDGLSDIALRLQKNSLVKNNLVFMLHAYRLGLNTKLQAGTFKISPSLSTQEVIQKLSKGGSHDTWFKIIEGQRVEEFAPDKAWEATAKVYEGSLFPDSYLLPQDYTIDQTLTLIQENFSTKFNQAKTGATVALSDQDAVILASLIEREGRSLESKRHISGILQNRLRIGMALQVDATVQYARDSKSPKPTKYWTPVSKNDLSINSPYNTYKNPGLPPSPICNPGYDSLFSVFHPVPSDYLYYITGNDGKMHYAETLGEHNTNIEKYLR